MILTDKPVCLEEHCLWERYENSKDIDIRNEIIEKYSYLVKIIAFKMRGVYQYYGDVEDIVNEGIIALMDAIEKFDISKNTKFETYASIRIRGSIIDYVRKQDWVPRKVKRDYKNIKEAHELLSNEIGRIPTDNEVADYLKINLDDYNKIVGMAHGAGLLSFEEIIQEATIEHKSGNDLPEYEVESKELHEVLKESINKLNEKEKLVVSLYYMEELKIKEIAEILEISSSRVSQIHTAALQKLEKSINNYLHDKY